MKILNPNPKWSVTFKPTEGNGLSFDVSLKRDTSLVQFSDYLPKEDLQIELQASDEAGNSFPVSLVVSQPSEEDFYTVDVSMRTEHKRYVHPVNEDKAREVIVQARKSADGRPVLRYALFPNNDSDDFIYHSVEPILVDARVRIADGFALGALRNQYTASAQPENELSGLIYENYRSLSGYSAILAGDKGLQGVVDLSSDPLTMRMTPYKKRIAEENATVELSYVSGFGSSHSVRASLLLTSRGLSDDLKITELSPGRYSIRNTAAYSLFPLSGDYYLKCGGKFHSVAVQGRFFPARTSLDWENPGPDSEILTFSTANLFKGLEPCEAGWKLESMAIHEIVPENYPEREPTRFELPR